ncbi:MAG: hypothetical protein DRP64_15080 [Verrucomicrobia bacterium]|nr:MAG: hypothetical protein DRP64_15080 [Verrucomicrobiota bacterium]
MNKTAEKLARLFQRKRVMDMGALRDATGGRSRRSIFRDLAVLLYLSSYTHVGRYYTLTDIPKYDEHGLWFHQGIGFSRFGTLKATVTELVATAMAGYTHKELESLLRVKVHNTLLGLVRAGQIGRESIYKRYLYVNSDQKRAAAQVARRQEQKLSAIDSKTPPFAEAIIAVLVEALQAGKVLVAPSVVADRLSVRGLAVTATEVEKIFFQYGLQSGKKTAEPPSVLSRR